MPELIFIGRKNEIATLRDAWHRAKAGNPQMVVLLDKAGLGKARFVQEFFGWLSEAEVEGPNSYWPDTLPIGRSLELNPPAETVNLQAEIPRLCWVMRPHDLYERNRVTIRRSPFEEVDPNLLVSAEAIMRKGKTRSACAEASAKFSPKRSLAFQTAGG